MELPINAVRFHFGHNLKIYPPMNYLTNLFFSTNFVYKYAYAKIKRARLKILFARE